MHSSGAVTGHQMYVFKAILFTNKCKVHEICHECPFHINPKT